MLLKKSRSLLNHPRNTVVDKYPMQRVFELLDEVGQGKVFSVIDLSQGFWNQQLDEASKHKTAFGVPGLGHFEYNRSAQGLCNSPSAFQRLLDYVTQGIPGVYVYIDDLVLVSKSHEEHVKQLKEVLARFKRHNIKCRLRKLQLATGEINYLGYNISVKTGIRPGLLKTEAIRSWQPPTDQKGVKSFLGLCSFFRRTIPHFASIASPLTKLTRRDCPWKSGELPTDAMAAFKQLQNRLTSRPCLTPVDYNKEFILTVDSSKLGIGAILSQCGSDGVERPCAYASRVLQDAETRYSPTVLEATGLLWSCKHFRPYLVGRHFLIRTDHQPLTALNKMTGNSLNRIYAELLEYLPFTIKYVPGNSMPADGLSRHPLQTREVSSTDTWITLTPQQLLQMQRDDKYIKSLVCKAKFGLSSKSSALRSFVRSLQDEVVFKHGVAGIVRNNRFLALCPHYLKPTLLQLAHDTPGSGHLGPKKTLGRLQQEWFWPGMGDEVKNYCQSCPTCQSCNYPSNKQPAPLEPMPPANRFNQRVHLDLLGPLPRSSGNQYILAMSDAFSSWIELAAIPDKQSETVAKALIDAWISRHSLPERLNSDLGSEFTAKVFKSMAENLKIKQSYSSAGHPRSAGQVENVNKIALNYLRKFIEVNQDWSEHLPTLTMALNTAPHTTKKHSPFYIVYGRRPNMAHTLLSPTRSYSEEELSQRIVNMSKIAQDVHQSQQEAFLRQKQEFDKRSRKREFVPGDLIYITRPHSGKLFQKFQPLFDGPYRVVEKRGHNNYKLQHETKRKTIVVHVDRMKMAKVRQQLYQEDEEYDHKEEEGEAGVLFGEFEKALRELKPPGGPVYDEKDEGQQPPEAGDPDVPPDPVPADPDVDEAPDSTSSSSTTPPLTSPSTSTSQSPELSPRQTPSPEQQPQRQSPPPVAPPTPPPHRREPGLQIRPPTPPPAIPKEQGGARPKPRPERLQGEVPHPAGPARPRAKTLPGGQQAKRRYGADRPGTDKANKEEGLGGRAKPEGGGGVVRPRLYTGGMMTRRKTEAEGIKLPRATDVPLPDSRKPPTKKKN